MSTNRQILRVGLCIVIQMTCRRAIEMAAYEQEQEEEENVHSMC